MHACRQQAKRAKRAGTGNLKRWLPCLCRKQTTKQKLLPRVQNYALFASSEVLHFSRTPGRNYRRLGFSSKLRHDV